MPFFPPKSDRSWDTALLAAVELLGPAEGHPLLFFEVREDVRLEIGESGVREAVHSSLSGLSARGGPGGRFEAALTSPSPADAKRLARSVSSGSFPRQGGAGRVAGEEPRLDPKTGIEHLSLLYEATLRAAGARRVSVTARWVAFDQRIWVARLGREIEMDTRTGRRVRLEVRVASRDAVGAAVGEMALRPGPVRGLEELAAQVTARAEARVRARPAPSGSLPVAFAPGVGGILIHELVGHALEADTVGRGASALAASVGAVAPGSVRIVDDPRRGRAAWRIDDEGEPARAITLVRGGKVAGLLHDRKSAVAAHVRPTGHGRRSSFQEPVRPRMGCTYLAAGTLDPAAVLEGVARGVYVRRMEAASADTSSGEATFRATDADLIHRGHPVATLKPFLLAVTTREALGSLERIASDLTFDTCIGSCIRDGQPLAMSVGAPTFMIGVTRVIP